MSLTGARLNRWYFNRKRVAGSRMRDKGIKIAVSAFLTTLEAKQAAVASNAVRNFMQSSRNLLSKRIIIFYFPLLQKKTIRNETKFYYKKNNSKRNKILLQEKQFETKRNLIFSKYFEIFSSSLFCIIVLFPKFM